MWQVQKTMKQLIDKEIIIRCKNGDKSAFRTIVQAYHRLLFSLSLKMLGDEEEAKDTVQEAFIKAWMSIRQYDESRDFSTWIYTIASRLCLDRLKRQRIMEPLPEDERVLHNYCTSTSPQRQLENKEWIALARLFAESLSEKQRLVFTLSALEGLEPNEIEIITGMNSTQVKTNLYHAKKTIRERLKSLGYE